MIFRIINKTTKMFLRDDVRFNPDTEQAIMSINAPKFGKYSRYIGGDTEQYHYIWEDTRTTEDFAEIERLKTLATEIANARQFILDFDYVENKIIREQQLHSIDILDTKSDKVDMTYREILVHKEECIKLITGATT